MLVALHALKASLTLSLPLLIMVVDTPTDCREVRASSERSWPLPFRMNWPPMLSSACHAQAENGVSREHLQRALAGAQQAKTKKGVSAEGNKF